MRYFIDSNQDSASLAVLNKIRSYLQNYDMFVFDEVNPELVISIGGDGRMLKSIKKHIERIESVAFVGISTGNLGFFCDYRAEEIDEFLKEFVSKTPRYEARRLIEFKMGEYQEYFVNEVRIEKRFETLACDIYINDYHFESYRGNGLNFSTPTGSTAYNRSLGGPIVYPTQPLFIMGEIAPLNNSVYHSLNSFLVLRDKDVITLKGRFDGAFIGGDTSHIEINDDNEQEIVITFGQKAVTFGHYKYHNHYQLLKNSFVK